MLAAVVARTRTPLPSMKQQPATPIKKENFRRSQRTAARPLFPLPRRCCSPPQNAHPLSSKSNRLFYPPPPRKWFFQLIRRLTCWALLILGAQSKQVPLLCWLLGRKRTRCLLWTRLPQATHAANSLLLLLLLFCLLLACRQKRAATRWRASGCPSTRTPNAPLPPPWPRALRCGKGWPARRFACPSAWKRFWCRRASSPTRCGREWRRGRRRGVRARCT
mmetsp:Transcript_83135/g.166335  ORF Transcript_83135/g.166335 Transcript_83135/m.166335 type:complete len:220 (-) Transcript_83135:1775-2434(-)